MLAIRPASLSNKILFSIKLDTYLFCWFCNMVWKWFDV